MPTWTAPHATVRIEEEAGLAHVILDRGSKMNSLTLEMFEDILAAGLALKDGDEGRGVSAIVLTGEGPAFCSGLDFSQFELMAKGPGAEGSALQYGEPLGATTALAQKIVHVWQLIELPVIAGIHGVAYGGGFQLTLGADIRIAAPDARLSLMEISWGIIPDMGGTQLLPEIVGRAMAKELIFTGRVIDGAEAREIGLVTHTAEDPRAAALRLGREIAGQSRQALQQAKRLTELAGRVPLAEGLAAEQEALRALVGSPEQLEVAAAQLARLRRG